MTEAHPRRTRRRTIAIATLVSMAVAGAAVAYWTASGSGTGTATTGVSTAFTVTSDAAVGAITPGGPGAKVEFTVENLGTGVQRLRDVTVSIATGPAAPWVPPAGCSISDYTATISTAPPLGDIEAGGSVDGTITVTLANTAANQDSCQGEAVPLYIVAS
jgi:hypothetical protein